MSSLVTDLRATGLELIETHISRVFLGETEVWKVKKPVSLGFLDFRELSERKAACDAEVRLNRRLAPEVYLGVVPITVEDGRHRIGGEGPVVDWAVHMVRMPDRERADVRLERGELDADGVERIAGRIAAFHARAADGPRIGRFGTVEAILANVRENFEQTRTAIGEHLPAADVRTIESYQLDFLQHHRSLFDARRRAGRIRDAHGDLRLEQMYLDDEGHPTILDCIEFNERFRYVDVCADIAFLSMDLAARRRVDLAEVLLAAYARESNDYDLYLLVDFYESYRAFVRGKVATMLANDPSAETETRSRAAGDARHHFLLALAAKRPSLMGPAVVAVGGIIASGKSTAARHLGRHLGGPVIDSDRTRKHLARVGPTDPLPEEPWAGVYADSMTAKVYEEVFRRARAVLQSGRPVVIDASFRSRADRRAARVLAEQSGARFYFIECQAPLEVCRARLGKRALGPSVSDGREEILQAFVSRFEPVDELPPEEHILIDTTGPFEVNLARLRASIPGWPTGLTG
ncbi:MAG: AAA family ATPase [Gemmatimonadales bacterium]